MYPHERSLVKKLKDVPFTILGVNSDPDLKEIQRVVKEKEITWRSFWNGPKGTGGPISETWNVSGWPTIYIIDAKGVIRHKQAGGNPATLDKAITDVLAEMGHEVDLSKIDEHDEDGDEKEAKEKGNDNKEAEKEAANEKGGAEKETAEKENDK